MQCSAESCEAGASGRKGALGRAQQQQVREEEGQHLATALALRQAKITLYELRNACHRGSTGHTACRTHNIITEEYKEM